MSWFEVIHFRTIERETEQLVPLVQQLVSEAEEEGSCREIKMYRRALVDTDLSILLYHDTLKVEKNGSSLGLRMALALKEFGMVNHTTWLEIYSP
jgi:hypothetical protein